ncbi:MAG: hypothetical protein QXM86_03645 [Candidatus Bathyarchaeia archaeon]
MHFRIAILLFLFCLLFISPVFADWTLIQKTGEWIECERNYFRRAGWCEGNATWQINVSSFKGYTLKFRFPTWNVWREWWQWHSDMNVEIIVKINDGNCNLWIFYQINGWTDTFGLTRGVTLYSGVKENAASFDPYWDSNVMWRAGDIQRECQLIVNDRSVTFLVYYEHTSAAQGNYLGNTKTYNYTFYNKPVNVTLTYHHYGQGCAVYQIIDEQWSGSTPPPHEATFMEQLSWWQNFWNTYIAPLFSNVGQWISWLSAFLSILVNAFKLSFPFLPVIVLCWLMDAIATSIIEGNLQPIGTVFMTIYDFIRGIIQTIVNIETQFGM